MNEDDYIYVISNRSFHLDYKKGSLGSVITCINNTSRMIYENNIILGLCGGVMFLQK